ncbi:MAG: hypothetical protein ACRBBN_19890 [Methyloligellaceae bacterium]
MSTTLITLAVITAAVAILSILLSPRSRTTGSFYQGHNVEGKAPGILTLTFSQVTTWIFARSIMNAAILGYFYGIAGALAYAAYYFSFLTGAHIISSLRFKHGYGSVQSFLSDRFGLAGTASYNLVIGVRLISEVFANLLVIGLIFGAEGTLYYAVPIVLVGLVTFGYALMGGLNASIRTDFYQMSIFIVLLAVLMIVALTQGGFQVQSIIESSANTDGPGWVLLVVALLQVWSYPMHDPVMMDRGFIADRRTTMASFYNAAWISFICIMAFGLLGVWAGLEKQAGESLIPTLTRLLGEWPMLMFNAALVISCMSTLDSTFSSAAKLTIIDMKVGEPTVKNGRIAMFCFLVGGMAMVFLGSKDLFSAVAVSGTASMFLAPVVFFSLWGNQTNIPVWSYLTAFFAAMTASVLYFTETSKYTQLLTPLTGLTHKYSILLVLCVAVLIIGCGAFALGMITNKRQGMERASMAG